MSAQPPTLDRQPTRAVTARARVWAARWSPILPLLFAEFVVWLGFGGLLPVLPLYFTEQGIDLATLGLVIAAWPLARLVSEPFFGWVADRTARVPLMVIGLVGAGVFAALPLFVTGAAAFVVLRALAGLSAAVYDPAARGFMTDATPPARRGEAFGLYGAAQMGGLLLGPSLGALGASLFGGIGFVFVFSGITSIVAALGVAAWTHEDRWERHPHATPVTDQTEFPPDSPSVEERWARDLVGEESQESAASREADGDPGSASGGGPNRTGPDRTVKLLNRGLLAAIVINAGGAFGGGTYEVIWSLFLEGLGADLTLIGITFAMFGLPVLLFSPIAGRVVDRRGPFAFIVLGTILPAVTGILYTRLTDPVLAVPLILVEATGFALLSPALYSVVAANSPPERSSTAQGLFGAAGTLGFIAASLLAGTLAAMDILYPFYLFSTVLIVCLLVGLAIGGQVLRRRPGAVHPFDRGAAEP